MTGRTVVWQARFETELGEVSEGSPRRMDDIMVGLDAMVSARPENGQQVPGSERLFYVAATRFGERLLFFYTFNGDQVFMESVLPIEGEDSAL